LRPLISNNVDEKLDEIVTFCFFGNRLADRAMSVIDVKFVMPQTEKLLHQKIAHLFPNLGDVVSSYQASRSCLTVYGLTPKDDSDYISPKEFFDKLLDYMTDFESLCYDARNLAFEDNDMTTVVFLDKFIRTIIRLTSACILLVDKSEKYNGDWMRFDHDIEDFFDLPDFVDGKWM
jgi:hypothetical protein